MQEYEYLDDGGRALCRLHHRLRCDECFYVSELREQNKRYREALEEISQKRMAYADMAGVLRIAREALEGEE